MDKKQEKHIRHRKMFQAVGSILLTVGSMVVMPYAVNWGAAKINKLMMNTKKSDDEWNYEPEIVRKGKEENIYDRQ